MEMQKGVAVFERDDVKTSAIFIDHEVVEFARMNAKIKKQNERTNEDDTEAEVLRRRAEKAEARRRAYTMSTVFYILTRAGISVAAALAGMAGMIHPAIYIPVIGVCLCAACIRLGVWFGRVVK